MMRPGVDQLQANLLMLPGLGTIDEAFNVFGIPFFFQSDAEGQYVLEKLTPMLEKRLDAKGFKLLAWGSAGWVQLFSKKPMKTLADVKTREAVHEPGRRQDGPVVQGQRLPPRRARRPATSRRS